MTKKTTKHPGGRPQIYTKTQIKEIAKDFAHYIFMNDDPTIVKFTSSYKKYSINKDYISDHDEFSDLRKRAIEKQEAYLLEIATNNKANPTVAIFRLKQPQHGYKDKTEVDQNINGKLETNLNDNQIDQLIRSRANRDNS